MIDESFHITSPKMQAAVDELQELIRSHYSETTFTVGDADDPDSVYMRAVVDVDDTDEVTDVLIDRLVDLQVDENLPIYVVTVRTPERIAAQRQHQAPRVAPALSRQESA
ncbi:MAG: hypothetical protein ACR2GS_10850 [Thermomicrobiales bacterium]|jgi:hypothetical protein